jgi:hypothetical protein
MQAAFETRSLSVLEGAVVIGTGIALLVVVEVEKRFRFLLGRVRRTASKA